MSPTRELTPSLAAAYLGLSLLATAIIYGGAHASLKLGKKTTTDRKDEDKDDEEEEEEAEVISRDDALVMPIVLSAALAGLWATIKYLGPDKINLIAGGICGLMGIQTVSEMLNAILKRLFHAANSKNSTYKLSLTRGATELWKTKWHARDMVGLAIATATSAGYAILGRTDYRALAFFGSVLAVSFAWTALKYLKLDSFRTGVLLLTGLLIYDISWVFGTKVMVEVASSLDLPVKILWPQRLPASQARDFMMLGLGDIVMPGCFVATALRYDHARFLASGPEARTSRQPFPKPYFTGTIVSYFIGLLVTMGVMHYVNHAQPALLYLSPACCLSFLFTAISQNDFHGAWNWTDGETSPIDAKDRSEDRPDVGTRVDGHASDTTPTVSPAAEGGKTNEGSEAIGVTDGGLLRQRRT